MQRGDKKFIFLIVFMILGIITTIQIKTTLNANKQKTVSALNIDKLKAQLNDELSVQKSLNDLINENEKRKEDYLKSKVKDQSGSQLKHLKEELDSVKLKGGLTDVKGPGVIVKLDDAPARSNEGLFDPNELLIHDIDVVGIMNKLKNGGAQAISINGERIIATSEQVCAGPTIRINKNRYTVPYEIKAIGDPDLMYESLNTSEAIAIMLQYKIKVEITKSKEIVIPKYNKNLDNIISALEVLDK